MPHRPLLTASVLLVLATAHSTSVPSIKAELRLAAARAQRGFSASPSERATLQQLAANLEASAALDPSFSPTDSPLLPGKWVLDFTDAADVLSLPLAPLPFDIGDVYQEIETAADGSSFAVSNAVEVLPPGSGLLSAIANTRPAGLYAVEAVCRPLDAKRVSLLFVGASLQPVSEPFALPALRAALPSPVQSWLQGLVGERVFLETSFLDEDLRIGRGPGRELYVLSKRR